MQAASKTSKRDYIEPVAQKLFEMDMEDSGVIAKPRGGFLVKVEDTFVVDDGVFASEDDDGFVVEDGISTAAKDVAVLCGDPWHHRHLSGCFSMSSNREVKSVGLPTFSTLFVDAGKTSLQVASPQTQSMKGYRTKPSGHL